MNGQTLNVNSAKLHVIDFKTSKVIIFYNDIDQINAGSRGQKLTWHVSAF